MTHEHDGLNRSHPRRTAPVAEMEETTSGTVEDGRVWPGVGLGDGLLVTKASSARESVDHEKHAKPQAIDLELSALLDHFPQSLVFCRETNKLSF